MSDGTISQDEIEALLSGVDMGGLSGAAGTSNVNIDTSVLKKFADDIKDELLYSLSYHRAYYFKTFFAVLV